MHFFFGLTQKLKWQCLLYTDVARSADLTSISAGDPFSLNEAKQFIVERISEWANPWNIWQQNGRGPSARRLSENKL